MSLFYSGGFLCLFFPHTNSYNGPGLSVIEKSSFRAVYSIRTLKVGLNRQTTREGIHISVTHHIISYHLSVSSQTVTVVSYPIYHSFPLSVLCVLMSDVRISIRLSSSSKRFRAALTTSGVMRPSPSNSPLHVSR